MSWVVIVYVAKIVAMHGVGINITATIYLTHDVISNYFNAVNTLWHLIIHVILDSDGVLFSCGQEWTGMLGRPVDIVPSTKFGRVAMDDAVLAVAVGFDHVLVMTATKVG